MMHGLYLPWPSAKEICHVAKRKEICHGAYSKNNAMICKIHLPFFLCLYRLAKLLMIFCWETYYIWNGSSHKLSWFLSIWKQRTIWSVAFSSIIYTMNPTPVVLLCFCDHIVVPGTFAPSLRYPFLLKRWLISVSVENGALLGQEN